MHWADSLQSTVFSPVRDTRDSWVTAARGLQQSEAEDVRRLVMMNLDKFLRNFDFSPEKGRFRSCLGRIVRNAIFRYDWRPNPPGRALDTAVMATVPDEDPDETDDLLEPERSTQEVRKMKRVFATEYRLITA